MMHVFEVSTEHGGTQITEMTQALARNKRYALNGQDSGWMILGVAGNLAVAEDLKKSWKEVMKTRDHAQKLTNPDPDDTRHNVW